MSANLKIRLTPAFLRTHQMTKFRLLLSLGVATCESGRLAFLRHAGQSFLYDCRGEREGASRHVAGCSEDQCGAIRNNVPFRHRQASASELEGEERYSFRT